MSNGNGGLNEDKRKLLSLILSSVVSLNAGLAGIAAATGIEVPTYIYFGLSIATMIAWNISTTYSIKADKAAAASGPSTPA